MKVVKYLLIIGLVIGLAGVFGCDDDDADAEAEPTEEEAGELELEEEPGAEEEEEAAEAPSEPVIGELAPDFTLVDETGEEHTLSDYRGQTVVLEWFNIPCPFVVRHYEAGTFGSIIDEFGGDDELTWLAIDTTWDNTPEDTLEWKEETADIRDHDYPVLQDPDAEVGNVYGAKTTPHMFVIDEEGILQYMGAIDDDPRGRSDEPDNHVVAALTAMRDGEAVSPTETEPYGCTVKYDEDS